MENLTEQQDNTEVGDVSFLEEGASFEENFLRSLIKGYENAWNTNNQKNEIKYELTVTTHKIATPDGNKDCAYLRLTRGIKPKGSTEESEWALLLVHQEIYWFKNIKEQLNPVWREKLYLNTIARLVSGGLEYAELLKKMQLIEEGKKQAAIPEEERLEKIGLVKANEMPKPLSQADQEYKEWLAKERAKEGLN